MKLHRYLLATVAAWISTCFLAQTSLASSSSETSGEEAKICSSAVEKTAKKSTKADMQRFIQYVGEIDKILNLNPELGRKIKRTERGDPVVSHKDESFNFIIVKDTIDLEHYIDVESLNNEITVRQFFNIDLILEAINDSNWFKNGKDHAYWSASLFASTGDTLRLMFTTNTDSKVYKFPGIFKQYFDYNDKTGGVELNTNELLIVLQNPSQLKSSISTFGTLAEEKEFLQQFKDSSLVKEFTSKSPWVKHMWTMDSSDKENNNPKQ